MSAGVLQSAASASAYQARSGLSASSWPSLSQNELSELCAITLTSGTVRCSQSGSKPGFGGAPQAHAPMASGLVANAVCEPKGSRRSVGTCDAWWNGSADPTSLSRLRRSLRAAPVVLPADLARRGVPIGPNDLFIVATALAHELTLIAVCPSYRQNFTQTSTSRGLSNHSSQVGQHWASRSRDRGHSRPPPRIRTGGFPASGSCLRW
jgi:hypothetical protein